MLFLSKKIADVGGCTTPDGETGEVNTYFAYLIKQIDCVTCDFRFQYILFL